MSTTETKELARRYIDEVWSRGDLSRADEWVTPDYRGSTRAQGQVVAEGPDGLRRWVSGLAATFGDISKSVRSLVAEGDRVVAEVEFRARHRATGAAVQADQVYILNLRDGRIAAESVFFDVGGVRSMIADAAPACAARR
jgi:ketosteroid isomerase-like protein